MRKKWKRRQRKVDDTLNILAPKKTAILVDRGGIIENWGEPLDAVHEAGRAESRIEGARVSSGYDNVIAFSKL